MSRWIPNIRVPDKVKDPVGYERAVQIIASAFAAQIPKEDLEDAGMDNPNWRPYCLKCDTFLRMKRRDYGFQCSQCLNTINHDGFHYTQPEGDRNGN